VLVVVRLCKTGWVLLYKVGAVTRWVLPQGGCCYKVGAAARWVMLYKVGIVTRWVQLQGRCCCK